MTRLIVIAALGALVAGHVCARDCSFESGEARWAIKTSIPAGSNPATPQPIAIASLIALKNPSLAKDEIAQIESERWSGSVSLKDESGHQVELKEGDLVKVTAYLYRSRCQKDGDFHMEIGAGPTRSSKCFIVEVPDPEEIHDGALQEMVQAARDKLVSMDASVFQSKPKKGPIKVIVTGQLFLDETHNRGSDPGGGRGTLLNSGKHCAANLWELHPVIAIE